VAPARQRLRIQLGRVAAVAAEVPDYRPAVPVVQVRTVRHTVPEAAVVERHATAATVVLVAMALPAL
jgi:hypothetical protein